MPIGSHQSANMQTDEWLTPPWIIERLGPFDLDPCSPINRPWDTANQHYTKSGDSDLFNNDGLSLPWFGRVWLNPPYGSEIVHWMGKMAAHNNGIALIFARTETKQFFKYVWPIAKAVLFMKGRIHFHNVDGIMAKANCGAPLVLIAYGEENAEILRNSKIKGQYLRIR